MDKGQATERLQKLVARMVATHAVGRHLVLIGGFRYRFLSQSARMSDDIDYHWTGSLEEKQGELVSFLNRIAIPEARRILRYDGRAEPHRGPDEDSPAVRIVDLAFWREGVAYSRVEIPVEIMRIICADDPTIRTVDGTIYATVSDADMVESKIIAILNGRVIRHRDLIDVFLFKDQLLDDSSYRLMNKIETLGIRPEQSSKRIADLQLSKSRHARAAQAVIDSQLEAAAANQLNDAGGGKLVVATIHQLLSELIEVHDESA